ncbi:glycosyl transferase family 28 [Nocardioides anomalus]|uniref:Glycosyl transferase family 28 n=1 Tax=Nocardioides anomalus TaxID=2712223 RepID=A0A6G6WGV4_9ACTN|nr:glycosyltransferase [Nocardioides anomalus]QIG44387.1 glycosyl transferase family 28 [Nocardioides anomalus]
MNGAPLVVALVGTDHHPFDRLVSWMDDAARRRPNVRFVVQHGTTRAPSVAEGRAFLGHDDLQDLLRRADVVVCHGGPGTITDAREAGHRPLCVPRDPAFGEHVDGHQLRFARTVGDAGVVKVVAQAAELATELDLRLTSRTRTGEVESATVARDAARAALAAELDELLRVRPLRRVRLRRAS